MIYGWQGYSEKKPEFEQGRDFTKATFYLKVKEVTTQITTQSQSEKIMRLLKESPALGRKELAEMIGDITDDGVKYHLDKLKKEGKIERIGGTRGYWKVMD